MNAPVVKVPDRRHEPAGLRPAMMWLAPTGLALLLGGALAASWLTVVSASGRSLTVETTPPTFPSPGVKANQSLERQRLYRAQREVLDSYGWVDREAGIARVPIGRAMELMTPRHLAGLNSATGAMPAWREPAVAPRPTRGETGEGENTP